MIRYLLFIFFAFCFHAFAQELTVSPATSLQDEAVRIEVCDVLPHQLVKLQASAKDDHGNEWKSWAIYQANEQGYIDISNDIALEGSYHGKEPMGLFFSMKGHKAHEVFQPQKGPLKISLELIIDDHICVSQQIVRLKSSPAIRTFPIQKDGLCGVLFMPPSEEPLPVIITLNGSNGNLCEQRAQLLASHGFAVLALAYFGMGDLPQYLDNIPLEYFKQAFDWLDSRSEIDGKRIGLYGISRGAELSLLLGTVYPDQVKAIAGILPSSVVFAGLKDYRRPAWTHLGEPLLPSARVFNTEANAFAGTDAEHPICLVDNFICGMQENPSSFEQASIPVEKITCPILVVSAGEDKMWPSFLFAQNIEKRLLKYSSSLHFEHLHYPKAGHQIGIPYLPAAGVVFRSYGSGKWFALGGTPQDNEAASQDSWKKVIDFFQTHLKN